MNEKNSEERRIETNKMTTFLGIMLFIFIVGLTFPDKVFLNTLYWLFVFFLIPFWIGHVLFYHNYLHPKRTSFHRFFGWGSSFFGICWAIGFLLAFLSAPQALSHTNAPDAYLYYLLDQARVLGLIGGISVGIVAAVTQMVKNSK